MSLSAAVVTFPASNCDHDALHALGRVFGLRVKEVWHRERRLPDADLVVLPGGFSYGDYLRAGAIARFAPIMEAVAAHAAKGRPVLGICNGFQILCEAGLLPGVLMPNACLQFLCRKVHLRCENRDTRFTRRIPAGRILEVPIAHGDGRYVAAPAVLDKLESEGRVVFRYCGPDGTLTPESNPNGSERAIAGIVSPAGNVLGMMPHPERAVEALVGGTDGRLVFESLLAGEVAA